MKIIKTLTPDNGGFYGELYKPNKDICPQKVLICFSGSDGDYKNCKLLAKWFCERGFNTFALPFVKMPGLPSEFIKVPADIVETAADWLHNYGFEKVGVYGISMGAELGLLAGSLSPKINAVIAVSPLYFVSAAFTFKKKGIVLPTSVYSWRGKELPHAELKERVPIGRILAGVLKRDISMRCIYDNEMENCPKKAEIAVENINGPILLISSEQDSMWPSYESGEKIVERLNRHDFKYSFEHIHYPVCSHYMIPMDTPTAKKIFAVERKYPQRCGESRRDAGERTIEFLEEW